MGLTRRSSTPARCVGCSCTVRTPVVGCVAGCDIHCEICETVVRLCAEQGVGVTALLRAVGATRYSVPEIAAGLGQIRPSPAVLDSYAHFPHDIVYSC
jgi:hypothetical protein